jgi:hypothetical protein
MAMIVLMVLLLLVAASTLAAISSSESAQTNLNSVRAQQAADAGLRVALYEYNALAVDVGAMFTQNNGPVDGVCYAGSSAGPGTPTLAALTAGSPQWCPAVTNSLGDGVSYSYVVSPANQTIGTPPAACLLVVLCLSFGEKGSTVVRTVVATGTAGNETRVAEEKAQMTGVSQLKCTVFALGLCVNLTPLDFGSTIEHVTVSTYYQPVSGSYRQCSPAAASVPSGTDPTSYC